MESLRMSYINYYLISLDNGKTFHELEEGVLATFYNTDSIAEYIESIGVDIDDILVYNQTDYFDEE